MTERRKYPDDLRDKEHIFYLMTEEIEDSIEKNVWFVNNSKETLNEVYNTSGGFTTADDVVIPMTHREDNERLKNVKPGEAVLIDLYDPIFDGDFVIEFCVTITADSFGTKKFCTESCKGGNPNGTFHWKSLPPDSVDPENPDEQLSPEKAALDYVHRTGRFLRNPSASTREISGWIMLPTDWHPPGCCWKGNIFETAMSLPSHSKTNPDQLYFKLACYRRQVSL